MKNLIKILIFSLLSITSYAQQASEIDPKFVKLPRYSNVLAIETNITSPQRGMMVYNTETASNWYYNGTAWRNTKEAISPPLELSLNSGIAFESTFTSTASGSVGRAGNFQITNSVNSENALISSTNGSGAAIEANTSGSGYAIRASTNTGKAGLFSINSATNINDALNATSDGIGHAFSAYNNGLGPVAAFIMSNADNLNTVINAQNSGLGFGGNFTINNPSNFNSALRASTNGTGEAILGFSTGIGNAGNFTINNNLSNANVLIVETNGLGKAAKFNIANPASSAAVIEAETSGSGFAGSFQGTNSLEANGFVKIKGFTQLGELSPKIKTVEFNQYIGAGSVESITHNLDASKILSINVYASLETGLPPYMRIPPSFISLGTEYYYDYYFDDTKIYFIIPSSSSKVKNFFARVLISYTE